MRTFHLFFIDIDCSQSPIFSWDRLDIQRLTVTGILIFKCTEGVGVGDYSSGGEGKGREKPPRPLSSFDTHVRWKPVTQSARSRWSYGKIEDFEQSIIDIVGYYSQLTLVMSWLPSDSCSKLHVTVNSLVVQIKKKVFVTFVSIPSCSWKITFLLRHYLKFKFCCQ